MRGVVSEAASPLSQGWVGRGVRGERAMRAMESNIVELPMPDRTGR